MAVFIFLLLFAVIILFIIVFDTKKDISFLKTILKRHSDENNALRSEIADLRKSIQGKTIQAETFTPPVTEEKIIAETITPPIVEEQPGPEMFEPIKPQEIEPVQQVEDSQPYYVPIPDSELPKEEVIGITEEPQVAAFEQEQPIEAANANYGSSFFPVHEKLREEKAEEKQAEKVYEEDPFSVFMKKVERQFADNWTGILGTAIMVLGIGYLSIYTALKVEPFYRVLILWAYAGLLIGSYYLLKKKEKWEKTGLWLRSAGASLFLFGCFGASQIPALAFISNSTAGYSLIGLGIALNLFVGYIIRQQTFLSLHVILSMLILCVIPDKVLATFLLAATTCTIGIILSYKEKWEYHLLVVIIAFIIFDIWFNAQGTTLSNTENILAIVGIIAVAASCMVMQYRSVYENTRFDKAGFITHLINWILFATGLILHSTGNRFKTFILFGGAIACFFMALKARKKKVYWLYHLDGMVAFVLCSLSVIMLNDWNIGVDIIACVLYLLTLMSLFMVYREKEELLHKIFLGINHLLIACLVLFLVFLNSGSVEFTQITNPVLSISILAAIGLSVTIFSSIKKEYLNADTFIGGKTLSVNGLFSMAAFGFLFSACNDVLIQNAFYYVMLGIALLWCLLRSKFDSETLDLGRIFFLVSSIVIGIILIRSQEQSYQDWSFSIGLFIVIAANWFVKRFFRDEFIIRLIGIIGTNALLLFVSHKYLSGNEIAFVASLLGFALLNHEFLWFHFKRKSLTQDNQIILYGAYYVFAIVASAMLLFDSPSLSNTELGLGYLGISVIEVYVLLAKRFRNPSGEEITGWTNFNLLNSDLLIFNAVVFGFCCLKIEYNAIYISAIALIAYVGFGKLHELKRYNYYSAALMVLSIALILFNAIDNIDLVDKNILYISQLACILLSIVYVYLLSRSEDKASMEFSITLPYVQNAWIIALLFLQVQLVYLPLAFMIMALANFWLIDTGKIKIKFHFTPLVALLAIVVSLFYSFDKLNSFGWMDWATQLGSVALGLLLVILLSKKETFESLKSNYQIVLNVWLSAMMFSQLEHKWLPIYWAAIAIVNLFLYRKKISGEKNISIIYYFLANLHLGFLSFNFYEPKFLTVYLGIFTLLAIYIYLAYKWLEEYPLKNSLLIYPATLSIGCFLYLTFDKGILTFFWILEALGLLILGILLKEKYFRYVSLSLVGLCIIRLMFFDLSNTDFLIRALVLLGVGVVLIVMNSLFKKYKDRFD